MYRDYESPRMIRERLKAAKERLANYFQDYEYDPDVVMNMHDEIASLEERLNFALQDAQCE